MEKKFVVLLSWVYLSSFELGLSQNIYKSEAEGYESSIYRLEAAERIIGGRPAKPGKYPFMIALDEKAGSGYELACGGAVLSENWIITAAHCIYHPTQPHRYIALAGLHKLSEKISSTVQKIKISEIHIPEDFDDDTFVNDIALLKTAKAIDMTGSKGYVRSIRLPTTDKDPTGYARVIGWGHSYENGENVDTLTEVRVPIIDRDLCNEAYDYDLYDDVNSVTEKMICAGKARRDACQNDSGGPLFQTDSNGISTLIGIVSHGIGCGEIGYPGVYTKVSSYKNWIEEIMSK